MSEDTQNVDPFGVGELRQQMESLTLAEFFNRSILGRPDRTKLRPIVNYNPMIDNPDFLRPIVADPDEDTPRLMYADWLDETADMFGVECVSRRARASLIRLQIDIARGPSCPVCRKAGRFKGTQHKFNLLMGIPNEGSDLNPDTQIDIECPCCEYWSKIGRVTTLLKAKYPVQPGRVIPATKPVKIAGEELWKPVEFLSARAVRYVRGFVGMASFVLPTYHLVSDRIATAAPLQELLICDRALNPNLRPYGKLGYFWFTPILTGSNELDMSGVPKCAITEELFDEMAEVRHKDCADTVGECYDWLSVAAVRVARRKAGLPDWNPKPRGKPQPPILKGLPASFTGPGGAAIPMTRAGYDANEAWINDRYTARTAGLIEYKGFAALFRYDMFGGERYSDEDEWNPSATGAFHF